jgi:glycosyltransferase involved in cell wall biosynthesis
MVTDGSTSQPPPVLSIIIAIYNDWVPLEECLRSVASQETRLSFEVILVDDGSSDNGVQSFVWPLGPSSLRIVRQQHLGISAARNRGIKVSQGSILLFIDADSRLQRNCLAALESAIIRHPADHYFQLHLTGDCSTLVGRSEELRLIGLQHHLRRDDRIRYLNTAGFALRRAKAAVEEGLFETSVLRGEDTLLLAGIINNGQLPIFVEDARVQHSVLLSPIACLQKDLRSAYRERKAYEMAAARGCRIRVGHKQRLQMWCFLWKVSRTPDIGKAAWFFLVLRQALQRMISYFF